ncbi:MAG TPA: hypothetical protein VL460_00725 [Caulobacteraceae bacterium]|jgi:hypothetical protein|nr:hypothetical protein [Caulobacteraceae bacterium]
MNRNVIGFGLGLASAAVAASAYAAPAIPNWNGVWERQGSILFDPAVPPGRPETPPLTPEYRKKYDAILAQAAAGNPVADPGAMCLPAGMPRVMVMTYPMEILMIPGQVTIIAEWSSQTRRIFTDGRPHPADPDPTYQGHSIGHWEGDTLVVDTVGIRGDTVFDSTGLGHSDRIHVTERMRQTSPTVLEDQITVEDPVAFTRPWVVTRKYTKGGPELQIMEYVCEENNRNPVDANGVTTIAPPRPRG